MIQHKQMKESENMQEGLTFKFHADVQALLEAAVRTPLPLTFVNVATAVRDTLVHFLVLYSTLKKSFARLARQQAVVVSGHLITAHWTQLLDALFGVRGLGILEGGRHGRRWC